jgi:hypothetical protein
MAKTEAQIIESIIQAVATPEAWARVCGPPAKLPADPEAMRVRVCDELDRLRNEAIVRSGVASSAVTGDDLRNWAARLDDASMAGRWDQVTAVETKLREAVVSDAAAEPKPVELILFCPECKARHIDLPDSRAHRTHACQTCGFNWAPAVVPTVGVRFLPGCKDYPTDSEL